MKPMISETLDSIRNKNILLDTNVLIDSAKFPNEFAEFYKKLHDREVGAVLEHVIRLEFIKGARTKKDKDNYEKFIDLVFTNDRIELKPDAKVFSIAENISLIVGRIDNAVIELGDSLIAAQIANMKSERLYLATQNHHDFPPCLFDRIHLEIINLPNGKIKTVGIYKFNKESYKTLSLEILKDTDPYKEAVQN